MLPAAEAAQNAPPMRKLVTRFLRAIVELPQSELAQFVTLGDTSHSWSEETTRMMPLHSSQRNHRITKASQQNGDHHQTSVRVPKLRKLLSASPGALCLNCVVGIGSAPFVGVETCRHSYKI